MPKTKISEYSATANSNTDVASINIDEGCAPSGINNAIRAVMGHLKDFQQGTNGDPFNGPVNGTVGATTRNTGAFTTLTSNGATTFTAGTASTTTGTGTLVITGGLGVSGRINAANVDGIIGANTAAAGSFTTVNATGLINGGAIQTSGTAAGSLTASKWFIQSEDSQVVRSYVCGPNGSTNGIWEHYVTLSTSGAVLAQRWDANGNVAVRNLGLGAANPSNSGTGITFPATQSASSNANTLDDYEEGTFTPTIQGGTTAGTATYTSQTGKYTKIGNVVYFDISLYWNSGTGTGAIKIAGLPFQNTSGGNMGFGSDNLALTANYFASFAQVLGAQTNIEFYQTPVGGGGLANINYDAAANIWVSGFYFTST